MSVGERALAVRALGLYVPLVLSIALALFRRPRRESRRLGAAVLLGVLWMLPALLALQLANERIGWWRFVTEGPKLHGMPVELYLGWCCLWGAVPILAFRRLGVGWVVAAMVLVDLGIMPLCSPVVVLGRQWLVGETVAALWVLVPGLLLARWTLEGKRVGVRAGMQVIIAGGIFLFLLPEVVFELAGSPAGWALPGWGLGIVLQAMVMLALPGVSAVQEFAERGGGTPIPYDPPHRLVVSGIYRFTANPMQMGCFAMLVAWGCLLGSWWLVVAAGMAWCYGVGLARWDEGNDLRDRFGEDWVRYRAEVRDWRLRWRPYAAGQPARLYIAAQCGPCSEVARWFLARRPVGLLMVAAEEYPGELLRRMRYVPEDDGPAEDGVRAFARGLEHLHCVWALAGAAMRLTGLRWVLQLLLDAAGFGERELERREPTAVCP